MVLPIYAYGHSVLKKVGEDINSEYPDLQKLIENMWETMYYAQGVGLAAPQIGLAIRLFTVDTVQIIDKNEETYKGQTGIKQTFINAHIIEESGLKWPYEEGCLSIPDIRGDVDRHENVHLRWVDEKFVAHEATFSGINARVIQHEYDHIDGILFTEHLSPLKRSLVRRKLENIRKGKVSTDYRMRFPKV